MKLAGTRPNQIWLHYCTCILSEIQLLYSWRGACWVITIFKIIFGGKAKPFENSVSYSLKKNWTKISTKLKLHMILSKNQWEFWTSSSSKGKRGREPNFAFDKWICMNMFLFWFTDQPWIWNIPYTDAPDTHGNMWVPS